jgi:hypothetical protein
VGHPAITSSNPHHHAQFDNDGPGKWYAAAKSFEFDIGSACLINDDESMIESFHFFYMGHKDLRRPVQKPSLLQKKKYLQQS